jgi:subtilisin family serine protease
MRQTLVRRSLITVAGALVAAVPSIAWAVAYTPNDPYPRPFVQGIFDKTAKIVWPAPVDPVTQLWNLSPTWHLEMINAPAAWGLTKGSSAVRVGVIDTEFDTAHPDLQAKIVDSYNTESSTAKYHSRDVSISVGDTAHGTSAAGLIAADTDNRLGVSGVGFDASLVLIKVSSYVDLGSGATNCGKLNRDMAEGIRAATDRSARVISISMGCSRVFPELQEAVNYANSKDVVVVASAGNGQETQPFATFYPAALDGVVAVAALDHTRNLTSYSSRGPFVDIAAPAERVWTTTNRFEPVDDTTQWYYNGNGQPVIHRTQLQYTEFNGTSAAAPVVSGVVALIRSARPDLNRVEVENILLSTAQDLGVAGRDQSYGAGLVDANAAVTAALAYVRPAAPAPAPAPAPTAAPTPVIYTLGLPRAARAALGKRALLRGRLSPATAGIKIRVARLKGRKYVPIAIVRTTAGGLFRVRVPTGARGTVKLRITVGTTTRVVTATIA